MRRARSMLQILVAGILLVISAACANMDFERAAFDRLMRLQCEDVEARGTCNRSFDPEYREYRDSRDAYLDELEQARPRDSIWPGVVDTAALPDLSR